MRYQAKPTDTAKKLFIDLMNHYRFRVDRDISYGFIRELREPSGYHSDRFSLARDVIHRNVSYGAVLSGWSLNIESQIFENVIIPTTVPDLVETGEQLATMVMVAGIPYRTELPTGLTESTENGMFIAYKRESIYKENTREKIVLMPIQWVTTFILAALGVADEMMRNQEIHISRANSLMR